MFGSLLAFLGGSAFRMIWGEVSAYFTRRQEHAQEMDRMKLQAELDAATHSRNLEALRLQNELGVKTIEVQRDADLARIEGDAWATLVESTTKMTGYKWLDIWNGIIRPLLATVAVVALISEIAVHDWEPTERAWEVILAVLGIFIADRQLQKRGK